MIFLNDFLLLKIRFISVVFLKNNKAGLLDRKRKIYRNSNRKFIKKAINIKKLNKYLIYQNKKKKKIYIKCKQF